MSIELLNSLGAAWSRQDIDGVIAAFAEDAVYHEAFGPGPLGASHHGKAAIRAAVEASFKAYPGATLDGVGTPCFGANGQASSEWVFNYIGQDGNPAKIHGCDIFQLESGKVKSKNAYVKYYIPAQ